MLPRFMSVLPMVELSGGRKTARGQEFRGALPSRGRTRIAAAGAAATAAAPPSALPTMGRHLLLDGAEDGMAGPVLHLDPDPVAEMQEAGLRLALEDRLDGALLGDAGIAEPALR